jgi:PBP1b-binding outer membrane lipoprotein LpoB
MFKKLIYLILPIFLFLSGCSGTTKTLNVQSQDTIVNTQDEDIDEFSDEFEESEIEEKTDPLKG